MRRVISLAAVAVALIMGVGCDPENPPPVPDETNTGPVTPVESLTHVTPGWVEVNCLSQPEATVSGVYVDGGNLDLPAGCTLRDFMLDGNQAPYGVRTINGQTGVKVQDGEIFDVASTGGYGGGTTYERVHVHDSGADAWKPRTGTVIASSYCHNIGTLPGSHADCVQFDGPDGSTISDVAIIGNHFDLNVDELVPPYNANAAIQVNDLITLSNVTIAYNHLVGGNFTLNCNNSAPGGPMLNIDDNTFGVGGPSEYAWDYGADGVPGGGDDRSPEAQAAAARYGAYGGGCSNPDNEGNVWANGEPLAIS